MPTYKLRGIDVDFPFEAYQCQLVYMEKVIQSLQEKCNALLESPTGTGKTLCLLCATLAWRKSLGSFTRGRRPRDRTGGSQDPDEELLRGYGGTSNSRDISAQDERLSQSCSSKYPTIIYASRTHSQIRQVIQELKRSSYRPKMVVLGSREQLCIHDKVKLLRGKKQTNACQALCKKRTKRYCAHYSKVTEFANRNPSIGDDPIDIEDLINIGRSSGTCPYYLSREIHKEVDILFAPYNYLIDRGNRKSLKIDWDRSILIFDEAHNLESICADAASFDLPSSLLTACIAEANSCVNLSVARGEMSSDKSCNPDHFAVLKALLMKLEKRIAELPIQSKELGFTRPGPYIYELLADLNINVKTATTLIHTIEKAGTLLEEEATGESGGSSKAEGGAVCRLESMGDILKLIFKDNTNAHAQYYRVHVQQVEANNTADAFRVLAKATRTLSWWCFNPGVAMEEFAGLGVGSIILTSGTLSPLDSFAEELKLDFPIRLENPHVISGNQIWAGVASIGPSGYSFNSSYRSRSTAEYKQELGNAIVNFARIVPDGLLVFFPLLCSGTMCQLLENCGGQLNSSTIWERICKHKLPVVEPRQSSLFPMAIEDFMTKLKDPSTSGSVFFAVCRGKVSEGLDFADRAGRAVVVTGLPFATMNDPKVRLKREYLDQQTQSLRIARKGLTGEEWYSQQASRAVNQAIGRVIRHQHDYGAIIFCDERFAHMNRQFQISLWIQPHIKCYSKFGDIIYTLTHFFRDAGTRGPTKLELAAKLDQGSMTPQIIYKTGPFYLYDLLAQSGANKLELEMLESTYYVGSPDLDDVIISPSYIHLGSSHLQTSLVPEIASKPMNMTHSASSTKQVKQENISWQLREVVPANRSSLTWNKPFLDSSLKCSGDLTRTGVNKMLNMNKNVEKLDGESGDLNESSKKRRLLITGPNCSRNNEEVLVSCQTIMEKKTAAHMQQGSNDVVSQTVSNNGGEKGASFLLQVQAKLTRVEYKEFLDFLKALKSKAMNKEDVLLSITRLFSPPDRISLLHGFKDFVPAKLRSLYQHYLQSNSKEPKKIDLK